MPQITQCPHCRGQLQVRDENLGQTIRCPLCQGLFKIAAPQAPSPPPPPPPPAVEVEVIEPPASPAPLPSPPAPPAPPPAPKPKPSGAARKPAPKPPQQKSQPTPAPAPPKAERPRRPKPPPPPAPPVAAEEESPFAITDGGPPAAAEEENPFAAGGPLAGALGGGPAALSFEEGPPKPHRGTTVLVLGLLGWVLSCCPLLGFILGGAAIAMGSRDLQLMARNRMDRAGKGPTQVGRIFGIVAMVTNTLSLIGWAWRLTVLAIRLSS